MLRVSVFCFINGFIMYGKKYKLSYTKFIYKCIFVKADFKRYSRKSRKMIKKGVSPDSLEY